MSTLFQKRVANTAHKEFEAFHLLRENQEPLAGRIQRYWKDIGIAFPGVSTPWSAVFVSWCVKQSGATPSQFKFAAAHSRFVHEAINNATIGTGVFHGRSPAEYAPKVGDILQNNRSGNKFDFAFAATHKSYESHSAVVMEVGIDTKGKYLRTVGGNESDSVGMKEVRLTAKGLVGPGKIYIAVIETLL